MTQVMAVPIIIMIEVIAIYVLSFGLGIPMQDAVVYGIGIYGIMIFLGIGKWYINRDKDQPRSWSAQS